VPDIPMTDPKMTRLEGPAVRRGTIAATRRLGLRSAGMTMTPEEFDALEPEDFDDRYRYELIRGVLVVTPPAGNAEVDPNEELGYLLRSYQEHHPQGSALDVTLSQRTVPTTANRRRCDRAIWAGLGRLPDEEKDIPTIVVEFVSASRRDHRRDYEEKLRECLAAGVLEYWIIDRFRRIMTVNRKGPGGVVSQVIRETESYQTDLLPGFVLPLARLLAKADQWPRKRRPRPPAQGTD
jgi:Uma2 family endonuclease